MQRRKKMECGRGEGKESAYPSYFELLIYVYPCTEMHTRIRKCASMFVHIHTTHRYSTCRTRVIVNLTGRFVGVQKVSFFFYFPKVS